MYLVYFSTFEPIELTPDNIMQPERAGVPMLYDSASNPHVMDYDITVRDYDIMCNIIVNIIHHIIPMISYV